jgi:phage terminase large subunit
MTDATSSESLKLQFPEKLKILFEPKRYKILYGGRGGAKSWGVARALLVLGAHKKLRVLCAREFQNSIQESVHHLLESQIKSLGLGAFYNTTQSKITGVNGTEFIFVGLKNNINNIKSYEDCDIVWVEEAANVSKRSWDVLIPTIRKEGSEIWITFNPELETDETYSRFVMSPPEDAHVVMINWRDNPWFPEVLRKEMLALKARDPASWVNVWEGQCSQTIDGAVYAVELLKTLEENRRTRVPHDPSKPVYTAWDLGRSDSTSIWFIQLVGYERRFIDYYSTTGHTAEHFVSVLNGNPETGAHRSAYHYATHYLPHDAAAKTILHPLSFEGQLKALMPNSRTVVVPQISIHDGINAVRTMFPRCVFDQNLTQDGWQALSHYQYEVKDGRRSKLPMHNWASHGADAFRYAAVGLRDYSKPAASQILQALESAKRPRVSQDLQRFKYGGGGNSDWMSR